MLECSNNEAWARHLAFRWSTTTIFKFWQILIASPLVRPNPIMKTELGPSEVEYFNKRKNPTPRAGTAISKVIAETRCCFIRWQQSAIRAKSRTVSIWYLPYEQSISYFRLHKSLHWGNPAPAVDFLLYIWHQDTKKPSKAHAFNDSDGGSDGTRTRWNHALTYSET